MIATPVITQETVSPPAVYAEYAAPAPASAAIDARFQTAKTNMLSALGTGSLGGTSNVLGQTINGKLTVLWGHAPSALVQADFGTRSRDVVPKLSAALNAVNDWENAFKAGGGFLTSAQANALDKLRDALRSAAMAAKDNLDAAGIT